MDFWNSVLYIMGFLRGNEGALLRILKKYHFLTQWFFKQKEAKHDFLCLNPNFHLTKCLVPMLLLKRAFESQGQAWKCIM